MTPITWMPDRGWGPASPRCWRGRLSASLLALGGRLIRWAWHLAPQGRRPPEHTELEYCREAAGTGGALYVNGQLVGTLTGVQRL